MAGVLFVICIPSENEENRLNACRPKKLQFEENHFKEEYFIPSAYSSAKNINTNKINVKKVSTLTFK